MKLVEIIAKVAPVGLGWIGFGRDDRTRKPVSLLRVLNAGLAAIT